MIVDTNTMVSMTEANQNFSKVAKLVDDKGSALILKNNVPKYLIIEFSRLDENDTVADERLLVLAAELIARNKEAFEKLIQGGEHKRDNIKDLLNSIKGPVPDNVTTIDNVRDERWKAYENLT